jgi:membrane-bound lytic murein transglycosylase D
MKYPISVVPILLLCLYLSSCTSASLFSHQDQPAGNAPAADGSGVTTDAPQEIGPGSHAFNQAQTSPATLDQSLDTPVSDAADGASSSGLQELDQDTTSSIASSSIANTDADAADEAGPEDIWARLRNGYQLQHHPEEKRTRAQLRWYSTHQDYLDRVVARAQRYLFHVLTEIEKRNMPTEFALLPIVESAYDPFAYSHGRAMGMWQFIPATGKLYGLKQDWWYDGRRDIKASTNAALDFLQALSVEFDQDWQLALAAYNSGAGNVRKAIRKNRRLGKPTDFWSLQLPSETRSYVPKLLALSILVADPEAKGTKLDPIPDTPYWVEVDAGSQIDLAKAAKLAEISVEDLYLLNPGFNKWATRPDGPHKLLIPVEKEDSFYLNLAKVPQESRIGWKRHKIKEGETLGALANKYNTTVNTLKQANKIRGHLIRAGHSLIIPVSLATADNYSLSSENRLKSKQSHYEAQFGQSGISYTVKAGDSLWLISRRFNTNMRSLARWNGIATTDILRPGMVLKIYTNKVQETALMVPDIENIPGSRRKLNYNVKPGESLSLIANKFNINVSSIRGWNSQLAGKKYLQPGQLLTLYVNVTNVN